MRTIGLLILLMAGCKTKTDLDPVAHAGADQALSAGSTAILDGSASEDPGGSVSEFAWEIISMPSGSLGGLTQPDSAAPSLITDLAGRYVVSLVVHDDTGNRSIPDIVEVIAMTPRSDRPEAALIVRGDLGLDLTLTLDGSDSTAPAGRTVSDWTFEVVVAPMDSTASIEAGAKPWKAKLTPDTQGTWIIGLTVADEESASRQTTVVLPVEILPNLAPIARCGSDQSVATGSLVELNGASSYDPEGATVSFLWTLEAPARSEAVLARPDTATPRFIADVKGDYSPTLVVSDGALTSAPCTNLVRASKNPSNQVPVAFAGGTQSVELAETTIQLDGSDSFDPDGDPISYSWTVLNVPAGSSLTTDSLVDADQPIASLTPDAGGIFVVGLQVCDEEPLCAEDAATITVGNPGGNTPPIADAGVDSATEVGIAATLDGTGSVDPDGDPLTYSWTIDIMPTGSAAIIEDSDQPTGALQPDVEGIYVVRLTVDDGAATDSDLVQINAVPEGTNLPPVCPVIDDQMVDLGEVVLLDGSGTTDPNGDALSYLWTVLSAPSGSTVGADDPTAEITALRPTVAGDYLIQFQAMDGLENCFVQFEVEVQDTTPNTPPTCDAGGDLTVAVDSTAVLDGSGSSDPDGDDLTWSWRLVEVPGGSAATITDSEAAIAQLVPDVAGLYTVELVVSDGEDSCATGVVVTAEEEVENSPPLCRVSADSIVAAGEDASLDASATSDPDGDELTFTWSVIAGPEGATSAFADPGAVATTWSTDTPGVYDIQLEVNDGIDSCTEVVGIDVTEALNSPPVCDAGPDLAAEVDETVTLDARATFDPDGDPMTFQWRVVERPEGSVATISDLTLPLASFTPDVAGSYTIRFSADDGTDTCQDDMILTVTEEPNNPPVCDAGPDLTAEVDETVILDARATFDPDDDPMTFQWRIVERPEGSVATISDLTLLLASFTPDVAGTYTIRFNADDGTDPCQDDMILTVTEEPNNPPVCDAGPDLAAEVDETVDLDATATYDPDDDPMTFQWRIVERPEGSVATIADLTLRLASFTPDVAGTYTIRFNANDGTDACQDDMILTVTEEVNNPPVCDAGPDLAAEVDETVTLDARATFDPDDDPMTFQWRVIERPEGSVATISDLTLLLASFTPDVEGTYTIRFYADDGTDTCQDDMVLTASLSSSNTPPLADAGSPITQCALDPVDLDGSDSSDADGDPLTYRWAFLSVPSGSAITDADLTGADTPTPRFTPDTGGTYTIELTVDDGLASDTDSAIVSVDGDGAVLMLHLDETSGGTAEDASLSALDGTLSGGTWSGGRFFGALGFDGSTWITVPDDDDLDITDDFTMDWWMRTDDIGSTWQAVLTKGTSYNYSIWIYQDQLYFYGVTTALGYVSAGAATPTIGDGDWHHYAVTVSGGVITVFEDGAVLDSAGYSGTLRTTAEDLQLGRPEYTTSFYMFEGALDEVTIRNRTLAAEEITALADSGTQVCTDAADTRAPTAVITAPGGGSADIGFVRVEGTADDESAIVAVTVNGAAATTTGENYSTWVAYAPLLEGDNLLVVRAEDVAGNINTSADSVSVFFEDLCGDDTVLLLAFDEEASGTAIDWSEGGLDATEFGTGRVIGQFGNALALDGSATAQVPHDSSLNLSGPFSVEVWYRQEVASADVEAILHKGAPVNFGMASLDGFLIFGFNDPTGADITIVTPSSYADGDWHHVVGVYDGTDLYIYVDGTLVESGSAGGVTPLVNTSPLDIGSFSGLFSYFTGELDQIRIYDDALSTSEVVDLFAEGEACPLGDNLATGASATASTTLNPLFTAENTIDGDTTETGEFDYTMWLTENGETGWVELDFGEVVGVLRVRWANTHNRTFFNRATTDFRIVASTSRAFDSDAEVIDSGTGSLETNLIFHSAEPTAPVAAQYLRIYVDDFDGLGGGINEIEVYGLE